MPFQDAPLEKIPGKKYVSTYSSVPLRGIPATAKSPSFSTMSGAPLPDVAGCPVFFFIAVVFVSWSAGR